MANALGFHADDADDGLISVELRQAPLHVWQRATEHQDELMREMALLALAPTQQELPTRLLQLVDVLGRRYGADGSRPDADKDAALAAGLDRIDLTYEVPRSQAKNAASMRPLLDEAEVYCRTHLLTLAQPQTEAAFTRWYIDQFVEQAAGNPPVPWPGPWH